jgi:hypothetical protein
MTIFTKEDAQRIAAQVKANHAALASCPGHDFKPIDGHNPFERRSQLMPRYRCTRCQGELDATAHHWYLQGRNHADDDTERLNWLEKLAQFVGPSCYGYITWSFSTMPANSLRQAIDDTVAARQSPAEETHG